MPSNMPIIFNLISTMKTFELKFKKKSFPTNRALIRFARCKAVALFATEVSRRLKESAIYGRFTMVSHSSPNLLGFVHLSSQRYTMVQTLNSKVRDASSLSSSALWPTLKSLSMLFECKVCIVNGLQQTGRRSRECSYASNAN